MRPSLPRYDYIWDVNIVLNYFNYFDWECLPLSFLSFKLATLLALITAQRAQTLHLIDIRVIFPQNRGLIIPITGLVKQSRPNNNKVSLYLKPFLENRNLCVVKTIEQYLERTKSIRGDENKLFISFNKPHRAVTRSTISRWIKRVLQEAGIDTEIFKAHSTRAASSSHARDASVNIDHILSTAGWSNCKTFHKFYSKPILA